jgi:uncharacterized DUF497 family protein
VRSSSRKPIGPRRGGAGAIKSRKDVALLKAKTVEVTDSRPFLRELYETDDKRHTSRYHHGVKSFRWNPEKNARLKKERGVSFEDVALAIERGGLLDVVEHANPQRHPNQAVFVVAVSGCVHLVPFVEELEYLFLKTIIPSRKATREYRMRRNP